MKLAFFKSTRIQSTRIQIAESGIHLVALLHRVYRWFILQQHSRIKHSVRRHSVHLMSLALVATRRQDASHHFLLGDKMVDPLQKTKQALHITAPLVEHVVRIPGFGKVDQPRGSVDLGVDGLQRYKLADILLRLLLSQVQQLGQPAHLDTSVVLGHHAHVMLDDPLAQILPSPVGLVLSSLLGLGVEHIGATQMRAELLGHQRPAHQLGDGELLHQLGFLGNLRQSGVLLDAVQQI